MIYGDPFKFALQLDVVEAWNVPGSEWKNGVFALYIDGVRIFALVDPIELHTTFDFFKNRPFDEVKFGNTAVAATKVFENACAYFMGDNDELMEGILSLTCTAISDGGVNIYLMKSSFGDRIIWSLDRGVTVSECILEIGEVANVIGSLPPKIMS